MKSTAPIGRTVLAVAAAMTLVIPATAANAATTAADPDAGTLAGDLLNQEIAWEGCGFSAAYSKLPGLACADITVPRDWHNASDGNTITIRISKAETAGANREGILLANPGGPGSSGLSLGPTLGIIAPGVAAEYDMVGFDPRGTGQSTPLVCTADIPTNGSVNDQQRAAAEGCMDNPLTPYITTEQTVYDMDFIRALFGEEKLSYIGYSYGTWLGKWYQSEFPTHSHRFLLDSAVDLAEVTLEETWDLQPRSRDAQFDDMMLPYISRNNDRFALPELTSTQLRSFWEAAGGTAAWAEESNDISAIMYSTAQYETAGQMVSEIVRYGMQRSSAGMTSTPPTREEKRKVMEDLKARLAADTTLTDAARADANKLVESVMEDLRDMEDLSPAAQESAALYRFAGPFNAIRCQDGQWNTSESYWDGWIAELRQNFTWSGPLTEKSECRYWTAQTQMPATSPDVLPDTMMIQTEYDAATPYVGGLRGADALTNVSLISIDNEGSHGAFPYGTTCVDSLIVNYFTTGALPATQRTVCDGVPLPGESAAVEVGQDLNPQVGTNIGTRSAPTPLSDKAKAAKKMLAEQLTGLGLQN